MTRKEALEHLLAKVEAGELVFPEAQAWGRHGGLKCADVWSAYTGSLDAAKALHEAVLPGWGFDLCEACAEVSNRHTAGGISQYKWFGSNNNEPARAWLIAILSALIAQEAAE